MNRPTLGDIKVSIRHTESNGWAVQVDLFKENTLRGDAYWVTQEFRTFKKEKDAKQFASRFNSTYSY